MRTIPLFGVLLLLLPQGAWSSTDRTDISLNLCTPDILPMKLEIPYNDGELAPGARGIPLSFSRQSLNALPGADFPRSGEVKHLSSGISRCDIRRTSRLHEFTVSVTDEEWLHEQSLFCRLRRRVGGCRPSTAAELFSIQNREIKTRVGEPVVTEQVTDVPCVSSSVLADEQSAKIQACLSEKIPSKPCGELLSNVSAPPPVLKDGKWNLTVLNTDHRLEPFPLEPLRVPVTFNLGAFAVSGEDQQAYTRFTETVAETFRTEDGSTAFSVPTTRLEIFAMYSVLPAKFDHESVRTLSLPTSTRCLRFRNLPGRGSTAGKIRLAKGSLLSVEPLVDDTPFDASLALRPLCDSLLAQHKKLSDEETLFCVDHSQDLTRWASKRARVRFQFRDQDGTSRYLVWRLPAPAEYCEISKDEISCPGNDSDLEIQAAAYEKLMKVVSDPLTEEIEMTGTAGALPAIHGPLPDLHDFNDKIGQFEPELWE